MSQDNTDLKGINAVMTEKLKESLSALYDGEAEQLEARRALKSGATDRECSPVEHYSVIGDVMRGQGDGLGQIDLSAGVMQALKIPAQKPSRRRIGVVVTTAGCCCSGCGLYPDDWAEHSAHRNAGPSRAGAD